MKILVLSDTHVPRVANDLPEKIYEVIPDVDAIIHAGDFVEKALLDKLQILKKTYAVYGNMDQSDIRSVLKDKEIVRVGKFKIGIVHGHGAPRDIEGTVLKEFKGVDVIVFGHSHSAANIVKDGVLLFNPGSPTDKIFASANSYGILNIGEKIEGEIIKL